MQEAIDKYFLDRSFANTPWKNPDNVPKVHEVIFNNGTPLEDQDAEYYGYLGAYYNTENNLPEALKYLLLAYNDGNTTDSEAIINLAVCYEKLLDYDNMFKYSLLAIEQGKYISANNLGCYYKKNKDYDNMHKYLQLAIDNGIYAAALTLGDWYLMRQDVINAEKYLMLAHEHGYKRGLTLLQKYYYDKLNHFVNLHGK